MDQTINPANPPNLDSHKRLTPQKPELLLQNAEVTLQTIELSYGKPELSP